LNLTTVDNLWHWQEKPGNDIQTAIKMPSVGDIFLATYSEHKNFVWEGRQMVRMKPQFVPTVPNLNLRQLPMNAVVQDIPLLTSAYASFTFV
jgi:hypothetical protein